MAASNSIWYPTQHSFAGGEVSQRIVVRQDIEAYKQSVQSMVNMFPTLQGSVQRLPGLTFLSEVSTTDTDSARIIAFTDVADNKVLAVLTPGKLTLQPGFGIAFDSGLPSATAIGVSRINVVKNFDFSAGSRFWQKAWLTDPTRPPFGYPEGYSSAINFVDVESRAYVNMLRIVASQGSPAGNWGTLVPTWVRQVVNVANPTTQTTLRYKAKLRSLGNFFQDVADYANMQTRFTVRDGTSGTEYFTHVDYYRDAMAIGEVLDFDRSLVFALPNDFTGTLEIRVQFQQIYQGDVASYNAWWLEFQLDEITLEVAGEDLPDSLQLIGPWQADEMEELQYVQSPYAPYEVVIVHPNWPPRKLFLDVADGQYKVQELIPGSSGGANPNWPDNWVTGSFPGSCTAFQGRLMLGGAGSTAQTVWGSETGVWENFTLAETPTPETPIEFETTFRSDIKWLAGHKQLLVGTNDLEYTVSADGGLLMAGDIDARVNSGHGSKAIQPVAYADEVMFASERGSRVRAIARDFGRVGWTAKDLNVLAPHITSIGIVRMARMRNPHSMLLCVLSNGDIGILHYDKDLAFHGWSRMRLDGIAIDIVVMPDRNGIDIPYVLVQRDIAGEYKLYVEGWPQFVENAWNSIFMDCNRMFSNLSSHIITGLDHLEGKTAQVSTEHGYVGEYPVINGQVEVVDNQKDPIEFNTAVVGLPMPCLLQTLPPVVSSTSGGMTSDLRYNTVVARLRDSVAPKINGQRPPDRAPGTAMDTVEVIPNVSDVRLANLGWDGFSPLAITEDTPNRVEILALSYKLASKAL